MFVKNHFRFLPPVEELSLFDILRLFKTVLVAKILKPYNVENIQLRGVTATILADNCEGKKVLVNRMPSLCSNVT